MNKYNDVYWRDVQLEPQHWDNIPQSAGLWHNGRLDDAAEPRLLLAEEMTLILQAVLTNDANHRQNHKGSRQWYFRA